MIYFDHNASSLPSSAHLKKLFEILQNDRPANPSSQHSLGRTASVYLTQARKNLANVLNCEAREIIFTSGGTEANNLGTRGVFYKKIEAFPSQQKISIITSEIEHPCVLKTFQAIADQFSHQVELILISPNKHGYISAADVISKIKSNTVLISIMAANNEIGTIQPTKELGDFLNFKRWDNIPDEYKNNSQNFIAHQEHLSQFLQSDIDKKILQNLHFHVDAVQVFGKIKSSDWVSEGYDSFAISGHKVGALQGVGALILRRGRVYLPLQTGGAQEKNRRSGTENLPGILSLGLICEEICKPEYWSKILQIQSLKQALHEALSQRDCIILNSAQNNALPNTIHFCFKPHTFKAEDVILQCDMEGICIGSGAACSSGVTLPSHVILAMGQPKKIAENTIRISLGTENTQEEINKFLKIFFQIIEK